MERRTIITIVILAAFGLGFLAWYNLRGDDAKPEEEQSESTVPEEESGEWTPSLDTFDLTGDAEISKRFRVEISPAGGGLDSVLLLEDQFKQKPKTADPEWKNEYGMPPERVEAGPYQVVGTWDPYLVEHLSSGQVVRHLNLPFHFQPDRLEYTDKRTITRLVRGESVLEAVGADGTVFRLKNAPAKDDLGLQVGDQVVAEGLAGVTITQVVNQRTFKVAEVLESAPAVARVERVGQPVDQYAADSRFVEVKSPAEGVRRFVWPNPDRDVSDVFVQRDWWVKDAYLLGSRTQVINLADVDMNVDYRIVVTGWVDPNKEPPGMFDTPVGAWAPACYVEDELESMELRELLVDSGWGCGFGSEVRFPSEVAYSGAVSWYGINSQYFIIAGVFPQDGGVKGTCNIGGFRWDGKHANSSARFMPTGVITSGFGTGEELLPGSAVACLPDWFPHGRRTPDIRCADAAEKFGVTLDSLDSANLRLALRRYKEKTGNDDEAQQLKVMLSAYGKSQSSGSVEFGVYAGPKDLELLATADPTETLDKSLDFWFVGFLARPMLYLLKLFHSWFANWALAIVFLTVMIKLLLLPVNHKMYTNMQKMQQLKPDMETIQKKYGESPSMEQRQKMQKETMDLYKRRGVNPLGGCFPMLLQFPVYIALYRCIYSAVDLYQQPLFGWIHDMTQADPYYILPVALGGFMFIQQLFMPTSPGVDATQQKIMKYGMPFFFSIIMLWLPSGLVFYIFTNTVISIGQQWFIKRRLAVASPPPAAPARRRKA